MSATTTTTSVPEYISRLDALGTCTRDRGALYRRLLGYPTLQAAWDACENGADMCRLLATLAWQTPWGSPERRRFHGLAAEVVISLARPFSSPETDEAIDGMIDLLVRSEEGQPPTIVDRKLAVECDGHNFHERTKEQASTDRERDRELQAAGYPVFRFTGSDIWNDPMGCARQALRFLCGEER